MFRKTAPTVVRHLQRAKLAASAPTAARRACILSSSVLSSNSVVVGDRRRFKSTAAAASIADEACVPVAERPFNKILAANRGEIATRIHRASAELGVQTAGIYSYEGKTGAVADVMMLVYCSVSE